MLRIYLNMRIDYLQLSQEVLLRWQVPRGHMSLVRNLEITSSNLHHLRIGQVMKRRHHKATRPRLRNILNEDERGVGEKRDSDENENTDEKMGGQQEEQFCFVSDRLCCLTISKVTPEKVTTLQASSAFSRFCTMYRFRGFHSRATSTTLRN